MDTYGLLKQAISDRMQVVARYDGALRTFSPHALGTKHGEQHVLVFQFGGESRGGLPAGGEWRCLRVDRLQDVSIQLGEWHTAANVFNPQSCLDDVELVVQPAPPRTPAAGAG